MVIENVDEYLLLSLLYIIIIAYTGCLFHITADRDYLLTFTQFHNVHI